MPHLLLTYLGEGGVPELSARGVPGGRSSLPRGRQAEANSHVSEENFLNSRNAGVELRSKGELHMKHH